METSITLQEFLQKDEELNIPFYNNFYLMFIETKRSNSYRKKPYFLRFRIEHPKLEGDLTKRITEAINSAEEQTSITNILKPFEEDLYKVYIIIREYVQSDKELFC